MKLLLDQGLPLSAAALLRDAGIDTIHVGEIGMSEAEDAEIIQRAREQERVVATLDADFHTLLALDEAISPSVIRIRIERLRAQAMTDLLLMVIAECEEELEQGSAITVEPSCIRIRRLGYLLVADVLEIDWQGSEKL
jgi:predicted nuclease of predicted toxin-antitoxin system